MLGIECSTPYTMHCNQHTTRGMDAGGTQGTHREVVNKRRVGAQNGRHGARIQHIQNKLLISAPLLASDLLCFGSGEPQLLLSRQFSMPTVQVCRFTIANGRKVVVY